MKKIYLSLFTVLAGLSLHAQLTQANQAPVAGYTFQLYQCDTTGIHPGASGANANWNFSNINTYSNTLASYMSAASSNTDYPNATVAVGSAANNTSYYNSTASLLNYYGGNIFVAQGSSTVAATLNYTTPAVFAAYPMNLNTATTSAISGTVNVTSPLSLSGSFSGNCNVVVDGSGTLSLPGTNTTFTNALRVVTSQTINITTSLATATVTQINYDYYAVGIRNPVFSINTATANLGFAGTSTQTTVTRDKNAVATATTSTVTGISEVAATPFNLSVYPNPSSSYVQFISDSPDAKMVNIYDITGKLIDRQNFSEGKVKLDVSDFNTGLYVYSVIGSNNRNLKTGKLTVTH